ncbi:UNVERIFIED_ORG: hypothetical protein M2402_003205 [Rahnella aquatilis]
MPKGSLLALQEELTRCLGKKYGEVIVEIKTKGSYALYFRGATETEREEIDAILQET